MYLPSTFTSLKTPKSSLTTFIHYHSAISPYKVRHLDSTISSCKKCVSSLLFSQKAIGEHYFIHYSHKLHFNFNVNQFLNYVECLLFTFRQDVFPCNGCQVRIYILKALSTCILLHGRWDPPATVIESHLTNIIFSFR